MEKNSSQKKLAPHLLQERNLSDDSKRFVFAWLLTRFILAPALFIYTRIFNKTRFFGLDNLEKVRGKSYLVCTNHTSSFDIWMGFEIGFAGLNHYFSREYYLCGLGAVDRLGPWLIRKFCIHSGVLPVDRSQGLEQYALQDIVRLFLEEKSKIACLIYPEGTRSKSGFLSRDYKAGAGWVQCMTGVPVLPVYQVGYDQLPGFGKTLDIHIGEPILFEEFAAEKEKATSWINVTNQVMRKLFDMEEQYHPRRLELKNVVAPKNKKTINQLDEQIDQEHSSVLIGRGEVSKSWKTRNALLVAAKNAHVESVEWALNIQNSGCLAVVTKWVNTDDSWLEKLIQKLNEKQVSFCLRVCSHPAHQVNEDIFTRVTSSEHCRLVLLEGFLNPPSYISSLDTAVGAVLVSHEQAELWSQTKCNYFVLQGDRPGSQLYRSSAQMLEMVENKSESNVFWGASGILTPFDGIDCLRRGADFLILDGFSEWVSDNSWSASYRAKLGSVTSSKVQLMPDPEFFDLASQSACLIINPLTAFKLRRIGDCSGESIGSLMEELLEEEGYTLEQFINEMLKDKSIELPASREVSSWQRKDWQLFLRFYLRKMNSEPAYVKVDPTVKRLLNWFKSIGTEFPDTQRVLHHFCKALTHH